MDADALHAALREHFEVPAAQPTPEYIVTGLADAWLAGGEDLDLAILMTRRVRARARRAAFRARRREAAIETVSTPAVQERILLARETLSHIPHALLRDALSPGLDRRERCRLRARARTDAAEGAGGGPLTC